MIEDKTKILIFVFLIPFCVYLITMNGYLGRDVETMFLVTQSIVEKGSLEIKTELLDVIASVKGKDGKEVSMYEMGHSIVLIPFYFIGKLCSSISDANPILVKRFCANLIGPFAVALSVLFVFLFSIRLYKDYKVSLILAYLYAFSTIVWPYSKTALREPTLTLSLLGAVYFLHSYKVTDTKRHLVYTGIFIFLLTVIKAALFIVLPAIFLYLYLIHRHKPNSKKKFLKSFGIISSFILLAISVNLLYNYARFGNAFITGYGIQYGRLWGGLTTPLHIGLCGYLFSPAKSIFIYSPIFLLGVLNFSEFKKNHKTEAFLFLAVFTLLILSCSKWYAWYSGVGVGFGPRLMVPITPFFVLALGPMCYKFTKAKTMFKTISIFVILLSILVQLIVVSLPIRVRAYGITHKDVFNASRSPLLVKLKNIKRIRFDAVKVSTKQKIKIDNTYNSKQKDPLREILRTTLAFWWAYLLRVGFSKICLLPVFALAICAIISSWRLYLIFQKIQTS